MIPSTTVTGSGFTGSGVQTTTGSTASHSGSVTQHDVPPQIPRIESFSWAAFAAAVSFVTLIFCFFGKPC